MLGHVCELRRTTIRQQIAVRGWGLSGQSGQSRIGVRTTCARTKGEKVRGMPYRAPVPVPKGGTVAKVTRCIAFGNNTYRM